MARMDAAVHHDVIDGELVNQLDYSKPDGRRPGAAVANSLQVFYESPGKSRNARSVTRNS
jgi:hypothetical protein